ncbi:hypothetical protein RB2501_13844 [Robiginitalea biformata HTCC2501]|uniref:Uncharacterized protein n=1 Tax=Robiginitalea biformata (strain ATCC BAA-864 / DSM 15991 / KCTC 12146 / HTCC2501) TaxID=313596 RepID=A4CKL6_ROBBH|nr:hypothetical protein RB2501_13844 [Robiginitalea biformata HTCC2501]
MSVTYPASNYTQMQVLRQASGGGRDLDMAQFPQDLQSPLSKLEKLPCVSDVKAKKHACKNYRAVFTVKLRAGERLNSVVLQRLRTVLYGLRVSILTHQDHPHCYLTLKFK